MYPEILAKVTSRQALSEGDIFALIDAIERGELTDVQIGGFQVALLMKGSTEGELASFAKAMRSHCVPIKTKTPTSDLMDTCGTGGGLSTFNISTATAIVAAASGIHIAKHGSRSISSLSGSADVLEALGVNIDLTPEQAATLIDEIGISFIYAPLFHPVMGKVLPPEAELGIKTIFYTIIGPLINPAFAARHLLGVYRLEILDMVAHVAREVGYERAMFVHGLDGLDEISLIGPTRISELADGEIRSFEITPEQFGMKRCRIEDIKTGTPEENAEVITGVFSGKIADARRDVILLNAGAALKVGGVAPSIEDGVARARGLIEDGSAMKKLEELRARSNAMRDA